MNIPHLVGKNSVTTVSLSELTAKAAKKPLEAKNDSL